MHRTVFPLLIFAPTMAAQGAPASERDGWVNPGLYEIQPVLIGGLDSLHARVVYSEAATRDDASGGG